MAQLLHPGVWLPVPLIVLCFALFYRFGARNMKWPKLIAKCGATSMCALVALWGLLVTGDHPMASPLLWGIVFCMIGDGLLEIHFLSGMAAFGLGHVFLIAWIWMLSGGVMWQSVPIWVALMTLSLGLFRNFLKKLGRKSIAFISYAAVLMAMASIALLLPARKGAAAWCIAAGGVCFAASDLLVGKGVFDHLSPAMDRFALALYYASQYFLALSAWLL